MRRLFLSPRSRAPVSRSAWPISFQKSANQKLVPDVFCSSDREQSIVGRLTIQYTSHTSASSVQFSTCHTDLNFGWSKQGPLPLTLRGLATEIAFPFSYFTAISFYFHCEHPLGWAICGRNITSMATLQQGNYRRVNHHSGSAHWQSYPLIYAGLINADSILSQRISSYCIWLSGSV